MVWGLNLPTGFGEFSPGGDFEGWRERLKDYYLGQTPAVQKELFDYRGDSPANAAHFYPGYVAGKFIQEIGTKDGVDRPPFTSIKDHEPPLAFTTRKRYQSLGSLFMLADRIFAVDEALKGIIERLEPGVHRFFPIEIRMPEDQIFVASYYILVIGNYRDSFSPENSRVGAWRADGSSRYFHEKDKRGMAGLAFSKLAFEGAHLWRERRMSSLLTCISDQLQSEIASSGLSVPKIYRMMEV